MNQHLGSTIRYGIDTWDSEPRPSGSGMQDVNDHTSHHEGIMSPFNRRTTIHNLKLITTAIIIALNLSASQATAQTEDGFTSLFNGHDLTGWVNVNGADSTWTVKDEKIICTGKPICVMRTDRMYENFILELEWRHLAEGGNAGVFVWSEPIPAKGQPYTCGIEVQILDGREGSWYTSDGDIFPIHGATMKPDNDRGGSRAFPTEKRMKGSPEWNHYRIHCNNGNIKLAVNGKVVTTGSQCNPLKGYICLESEGAPIEFRNLRIKELPCSEVPLKPEQIAHKAEDFVPLYNGVDFTGWKFEKPHEGHWKANDWKITFDGGGADLWTEKPYKDFVLIADWRWTSEPKDADLPVILSNGQNKKDDDGKQITVTIPEAGDSGIYLRGNSKSQVNIWCWPIGSGEVYGYRTDGNMSEEVRAGVTPKENADAPIGQWNRFIITMKGDRLTVVLNGKTVLENAHLPGVPEAGPIALQKHGGALEFANIMIRELK